VALFERGWPGKEKACGDAYTDDAIAALRAYGLRDDTLHALGGMPYQQAAVEGFGERYPSETMGWVVRRARLDQWLRDQIPTQIPIRYGTQVTAVTGGATGLHLSLRQAGQTASVTCDAVILATGAANSLSQAWGVAGAPILGASLSIYAAGTPPAGLEFLFGDAYRPGYAWIFPAATGRVNLGLCALTPPGAKSLRERAALFARDWHIPADEAWRGGGEALWSGQGTRWHHPDGIISCGDAGGMVDPLSAEGITAALTSGQQAGEAIARFLTEKRDPHVLEAYSRWVKDFCDQRYFGLDAGRLLWKIWSGA
jgi:flavin-dependent dehydrogenase